MKNYSIKLWHTIVGVCAAVIILMFGELGSFNIMKLLDIVFIIGVFYIHAFVLLPILLIKKAVNRYIFLTFSLFAVGAVVSTLFKIASQSDYVYTFTKILYHGPAFGSRIEYLYKVQFFSFLLLFAGSFVYGLLVSKINHTFNYLSILIFEKKHSEFLIHVIFLFLFSITSYFAGVLLSNEIVGCLLLFYFHLLFVAPVLVKERKVKQFLGAVILELLLFCGVINYYINTYLAFIISLGISIVAISTIYAIVRQQIRDNKYLVSKKQAELQQLKSQVNPHFLFNSLNTLYSFALKENALNTAQNIKKLSNLIRFMLTDIEMDYIPLQNEVNYIKDYIDIQLVRCSANQNVKFSFENIDGYKIAPMLLIPFVENSFKHGINPGVESTLIINLECKANVIQFECRNSLNLQYQVNAIEKGLGIGIENIRSRLELIYPEKYSFNISKTTNEFLVKLEIYDNCNCN